MAIMYATVLVTGEAARRFVEEMSRVDSQPLKELPKGFYDEYKLTQKMK